MPTQIPDLWFSFVRSHRALLREVDRRLAEAGLPVYAWYDVLWGIESGPEEGRRMHELADVLAIERYNLTRLIDRLEREELVRRVRSEEDGRAAFLSITRQGKTLRKKMWGVYEAAVNELFVAQFRPEDVERFSRALDAAAAQAGRPR
ncbi:MarR family winged helix-turn-helix transcriptional regulator [Cupriavidus sp. SW-Y-13]|uniref:MarR family winged helix-turn-helix transcriptional regulator n=1 Tax=Cupriavidus sp. SW-Y-13 TaxID=2653854 RepID=UPI0013660F5A|nr:MarR family transcriptional regulator [Cupriavidus sp. SW-Y-13]MWL91471.1 MarR family transcriptional regulator [Cupriavidus sp. SW-Y-13]